MKAINPQYKVNFRKNQSAEDKVKKKETKAAEPKPLSGPASKRSDNLNSGRT